MASASMRQAPESACKIKEGSAFVSILKAVLKPRPKIHSNTSICMLPRQVRACNMPSSDLNVSGIVEVVSAWASAFHALQRLKERPSPPQLKRLNRCTGVPHSQRLGALR